MSEATGIDPRLPTPDRDSQAWWDALARHDVSVEELVARIQPVVGGSVGVRELKLGGEEVQYRVKLEAARKPMCTLSSRR